METRSSVQYWQVRQQIEKRYTVVSRALLFQRRYNVRNSQFPSQTLLHEVNLIPQGPQGEIIY